MSGEREHGSHNPEQGTSNDLEKLISALIERAAEKGDIDRLRSIRKTFTDISAELI